MNMRKDSREGEEVMRLDELDGVATTASEGPPPAVAVAETAAGAVAIALRQ